MCILHIFLLPYTAAKDIIYAEGMTMKLNLYVIKEELKELDFQDSQYDPAGVFNISDVHFCTKTTKNMQTGVAYVIESKLLPERKDVYRLPSVICVGKPPLDWISSRTNLLYTRQKVDPQVVYDKVTEVFNKYKKIEEELSKLLDSYEDLSCLDRFLPKYLSNPLNVVNAVYEPIYQYFPKLDQNRLAAVRNIPNYNFYYSGEQRVITNAEIYMHSTDRKYKGILKATTPSLYRMLGTGINMLFQNLYVDSNRVGYMEIIELVNPIRTSDYLILSLLMQQLRYWFKINTRTISTEDDIGAMTHALLKDKNISYGRMAYTLDKAGWSENDRYALLLVNGMGNTLSIPKVDSYMKGLSSIAAHVGHTTFDDYLVIIINMTRSSLAWNDLYDYVRKNYNPSVKTSISITFSPISNAFYAFTQTRVISKIGMIKYSGKNAYTFSNMKLDYFLYKCRRNQQLEMLYPGPLKRLMNYDASKGTNLVGLLSTYLDCERSITRTSEKAFLHRNTTMYQINKIQEIMNIDFEDADERLVLQIALKERERNVPDVSGISLSDIGGGISNQIVSPGAEMEMSSMIDWF